MIIEWLMDRCHWDAIWYLGANCAVRYRRPWSFITARTAFVGIWTGPDLDLICVKRCETAEEAERCLSPGGYTVLDAALRSWWKLRKVGGRALEWYETPTPDVSQPPSNGM